MARVIIIHGYQGHPDSGWKLWLAQRLRERGYEAFAPHMPDPDHPRRNDWLKAIQEQVGEPRPTDIFVGHSLGTIATLRYLETLKPGQTVAKVILVAAFYEDLSEDYVEIRDFIDTPVDWDAVRAACPEFYVIHSDDDDSVPTAFARNVAEKLHVPFELHHGYGHFSLGDGVLELPIVLEKI